MIPSGTRGGNASHPVAPARRRLVWGGRAAAALLPLALLAAAIGCGKNRAPFSGCHVALINIETLRADCCGTYGGPAGWTPAIDSLAGRGVLVERAYTDAPWTRPSVASLWTGLYPAQHGADRMDADHRLPEEASTLAERFAAAGYRTFGAVTNANLSPDLGFAQGFEEYRYRIGARADTLVAWAIEWVDRRSAEAPEGEVGAPLFLAFHFDEPHGAFFHTPFRTDVNGKSRAEMIRRVEILTYGERIAALEAYRARVAAVDRAVGRLARELESRLGPDLVVVITADHGEEWFDHGGLFHGFTLYEELLRVPLLFLAPGVKPSRRAGPVLNVDVAPTLIAWTGIARSGPEGGGRAVGPALLGKGPFPEEVFAETRYERPLVARTAKGYKYIVNLNNSKIQIYDPWSDPRETRDLAGANPGLAADGLAAIEKRRGLWAETAIAPREKQELDDRRRRKLEEELRSIGYLGSGGGDVAPSWPRGKRMDWRGLYRSHQLIRAGDPEIRFDGGAWKEGAFPPRRIGWNGAALTVRAAFREAWILLGTHPWSGLAEIEIDGMVADTIDLYRPEEGNRRTAHPIRLPDEGPHAIRIRSTGARNASALGSELLFDGIAIVKREKNGDGRRD